MRLVVSLFMSLDGVVQAPGSEREDLDGGFRHGGWSQPYVDTVVMGAAVDELMATTTALLFGRRTFDTVVATWGRGTDPQAALLRSLPKYVASRSLDPQARPWDNTTVLGGASAIPAVRALKSSGDGVLSVMGSAALTRQLVAEGLVDEYRLMIEPVLLGGGKRAFPDDSWKRSLRMVSSTSTPTGVIIAVYEPGTH